MGHICVSPLVPINRSSQLNENLFNVGSSSDLQQFQFENCHNDSSTACGPLWPLTPIVGALIFCEPFGTVREPQGHSLWSIPIYGNQ